MPWLLPVRSAISSAVADHRTDEDHPDSPHSRARRSAAASAEPACTPPTAGPIKQLETELGTVLPISLITLTAR